MSGEAVERVPGRIGEHFDRVRALLDERPDSETDDYRLEPFRPSFTFRAAHPLPDALRRDE